MEDSISFEDYLLGVVRESFVKDTDMNLWVLKKAMMVKLRQDVGDRATLVAQFRGIGVMLWL